MSRAAKRWVVVFFKQKTAYERCGRDWSSDVCSSDLPNATHSIRNFLSSQHTDLLFLQITIPLASAKCHEMPAAVALTSTAMGIVHEVMLPVTFTAGWYPVMFFFCHGEAIWYQCTVWSYFNLASSLAPSWDEPLEALFSMKPVTTTVPAIPAVQETLSCKQADYYYYTLLCIHSHCYFCPFLRLCHPIINKSKHQTVPWPTRDRKSTRLNSSHVRTSRMPSSAWKKKQTNKQKNNKTKKKKKTHKTFCKAADI